MKPECIIKVINSPSFKQMSQLTKDLIVESISDIPEKEMGEVLESYKERVKKEYTDMGDSITEAGQKANQLTEAAKSNLTFVLENFTLKKQQNKITQRIDENKMDRYLNISGGKKN